MKKIVSLIGKKEFYDYFEENFNNDVVGNQTDYIETTYKTNRIKIEIFTTGSILMRGEDSPLHYFELIKRLDEQNYVGMDEVGVGDFIGPTVYVSVKMTDKLLKELEKNYYPIKDSKKLKKDDIFLIYQGLKDIVEYHYEIVFDKDLTDNLNSVEQKSYYHYENLQKFSSYNVAVLDLYTTINNFWKVDKKLGLNYPENIVLETKADSNYYAVALASIFGRAIFLQEIEKINKKYSWNFGLGISDDVVEQAKEFTKKYSKEELAKISKITFKTFKEITNEE